MTNKVQKKKMVPDKAGTELQSERRIMQIMTTQDHLVQTTA